jgi:hypothetical protein
LKSRAARQRALRMLSHPRALIRLQAKERRRATISGLFADAGRVFGEGGVAHVVTAILDAPMRANPFVPPLGRLVWPLARQASRILAYLAAFPNGLSGSDVVLSSSVGEVSAEHAAIVRRSLLAAGLATLTDFSRKLGSTPDALRNLAEILKGIAVYLRIHKDRNAAQLVLTEPGEKSNLRKAIDGLHALSPDVFQTSDVFFHLGRAAKHDLVVLAQFIDNQGADLLVESFFGVIWRAGL